MDRLNAAPLRHAFAADLADVPNAAQLVQALAAPDFLSAPVPGARTAPRDTALLQQALDMLACSPPLAAEVRLIALQMHFYPIMAGAPVSPGLEAGLMAGQLGRSAAAPASMGMFLLAPGVHYPLHQHAALEVYYCVSGTLTLRHGRHGAPFDVRAGTGSVTPPHRLHALDVGDEPCLLIFCWTGQIEKPIYWWDTDDRGDWHRTRWYRSPEGLYSPQETDPVTSAMLAEAGEI